MLMQLFSIKDGLLVHDRIDREIADARDHKNMAKAKVRVCFGTQLGLAKMGAGGTTLEPAMRGSRDSDGKGEKASGCPTGVFPIGTA